jgi:hypothetical protein
VTREVKPINENNDALIPIATFCGNCNCGCPALSVNPSAEPERQIVITDDFGQRIEMSPDQFADLIHMASNGVLSAAVTDALA